MLRVTILACLIILNGCSFKSPKIQFLKSSKLEMPVIAISPSYKFKDEIR